ncbi:hypothetical protein A5844_000240 [Enterococcus sp. 10A9_DIV0425]|uniref:Metallo-beta-lactamase domain-containing protein n=1 Tax=Candidatus Enterococcus wittei TaxID=1987383 RepID=A0A2C9XP90_9ENTE|nr:hypothetical protein A5844_000240 [Enterococcus sp. 10A9_DIV0425]
MEREPISLNESTEHVLLKADTIKRNGDWLTCEGRLNQTNHLIQLSYQANSEEEVHQWENFRGKTIELQVEGKYLVPTPQRNPYGFDQKNYFNIQRISGQFKISKVKSISQRDYWFEALNRLRGKGISYVKKHFPKKVSMYTNTLLFGFRDAEFIESEEIFKETGLLHLFSLSGMHIQCYLGWVYFLFRRCGCLLRTSIFPMAVITMCYLVLAGGSFSVIRAGSLFLLRLLLKLFRINCSALDCFSINLWLLLLVEPLILFQTGGQLSLWMSFLFIMLPTQSGGLRDKIHSFILYTGALMPLSAWYFYEWPILGVFLTMICAPLFSCLFLPGVLILFFLGKILPPIVLDFVESFLVFFESVLSLIDFSTIIVGQPPFYLICIGLVTIIAIHERKEVPHLKRQLMMMFIPCGLIILPYINLSTVITFIDVGQGDSILLKSPYNQEVVLIDTGGKMPFAVEDWQKRVQRPLAENSVVPYLKGQGVKTIDKLVLTHNDTDHIGELETIDRHFQIKKIYIGWGAKNDPELALRLTPFEKKGTEVVEVKQQDRLKGFFNLFVLMPSTKGQGRNEDSLVLWFEYKKKKFLLLGDLNQEKELEILKKYPQLKADVVKLGHHGSRSSSHPLFLSSIKPTVGIISNGLNNRYGHPNAEVIDTLRDQYIKIFRTDQQGAIHFQWHPVWSRNGKITSMID